MTLLFADGFEAGLTSWTLTNTASGTGRFGNGVVVGTIGGLASCGIGTAIAIPSSTQLICGVACKMSGVGYIMSALASGGLIQVLLYRGTSGEIIVYRGATTTVLGTTATNVLPTGAWSYIECKFNCHDTTGAVNVRVNGLEVINLTNVDTRESVETSLNRIALGGAATLAGTAWDDFYLCDATGSVNNDFLGELMVEHLIPGSDDTAQWTGSDGNSTANYDLVNETGAYNSSDYVATSTVGQRDLYIPVASSRPITSPVKGVIVSAIAQKTDAGTRTAKLIIKEGAGGTERLSPELGLPTSFGELKATWDRKADGSAWTVADVNALRFGIEVVS